MKYRYRTESEMKDSGVEWIGKIPKDWETIKLKYISSLKSGEYISKDDYDDSGIYNIYGSNGIIGKSNKLNNIKKNIIIGRVGACGEVNIAKEGWISDNALILDIVPKNYNFNYILYSLKSMNLKELAIGTAQPLITGTQIKNLNIIKVNKYNQDKIANFLDEKTSQFDSIISKKEELIKKLEEAKKSLISEVVTGKVKVVKTDDGYELIKRSSEEMKDSGVEWLGEIPKDWEVKRVKYLMIECKGKSEFGIEEPLSMSQKYGLIKTSDMENIPNQSLSLIGNKIVKENDLVFNKLKPHLGVFSVSRFNGIVSPDYAVYRAKHNVNIKYLEYLFKTPMYISQFKRYATGVGAGLTRLYTDQLFNIQAICPYYDEQCNIEEVITNKITQIVTTISKTKLQIQKLKEAKQSLISEAVTGKIEILD